MSREWTDREVLEPGIVAQDRVGAVLRARATAD
jgi:hypothetical protein